MAENLLTDDMPMAPPLEDDVPFGDSAPQYEAKVDGTMTSDVVDLGTTLGEPVPNGWYTIKLHKYTCQEKMNEDGMGADPYFKAEFMIEDHPLYAGRRVFEVFTWLRPYDRKRAQAKDPEGVRIAQNRLGKIKEFMRAAQFTKKSYDVQPDFLDTQPVVQAKLGRRERKDKDGSGKWTVPTGRFDNVILEYKALGRR